MRAALVLAGTFIGSPGVEADQVRTAVLVGARVEPRARLAASMPQRVIVTPRDIGAGFIDVPGSTRLDIRTNACAVALDVAPLTARFAAVAIAGLGQPVELGSDGGMMVRRIDDPARPVTLTLHCRLPLNAGSAPGEYAWPLRFDVRPLPVHQPAIDRVRAR